MNQVNKQKKTEPRKIEIELTQDQIYILDGLAYLYTKEDRSKVIQQLLEKEEERHEVTGDISFKRISKQNERST